MAATLAQIADTESSQARAVAFVRHRLGRWYDLLAEPDVTDLYLNPDGRVWVTKHGRDPYVVGTMAADHAASLISVIAGSAGHVITRDAPVVECTLVTDGSRFEGVLPPLSRRPWFAIRRPASTVFPIAEYVSTGVMTQRQADRIERAIAERENIVVVGGTGTGKTTLLNAVIDGIVRLTPQHRIAVLEDTEELRVSAENSVKLLTTPTVNMAGALRVILRAAPDRIIVGEVRDGAALALLNAWNTGHSGGAASLHSNTASPGAALTRLETMVSQAVAAPQQRLISEAVDLIVCLERYRDAESVPRRRVAQIVSVHGIAGDHYVTKVEASDAA